MRFLVAPSLTVLCQPGLRNRAQAWRLISQVSYCSAISHSIRQAMLLVAATSNVQFVNRNDNAAFPASYIARPGSGAPCAGTTGDFHGENPQKEFV